MADKDKRSSASFVPFRPLDNLFEPTVQEKPQAGSISQISIGELFPFKDHPFLPYTEERMEEMVESVKEYGVNSFHLYASYKVQRKTGNTKVGRTHKGEEK